MKYGIGNKVRIKTWDQMEEEFGLINETYIKIDPCFCRFMEKEINGLNNGRIVTIKDTKGPKWYKLEEIGYICVDDMIECLAEDYVEPIPIGNRFEILDL
jgi:hypothetical protein